MVAILESKQFLNILVITCSICGAENELDAPLSFSLFQSHTHSYHLFQPYTHPLSFSLFQSHTHSFSLSFRHTHTLSFSLSSAFITSDPFYCISQLISVIKIFFYGVQPAKVKLLWLSGSLALQSKPFNLSFQILARSLCSCL